MVVCRFFLQGTCKFGNDCRFDHQLDENYNAYNKTSHTSILRQSNFGSTYINNTNPPENPVVDTNTLIKVISTDAISVEKGGQWLLSCYAPFKEKPCIGGFEDQSFEEIRFGYYEAAKNGNLPQYKQQIQSLLQSVVTKIKTLQAPTPDIVHMLKTTYDVPPSAQVGLFASNSFRTDTGVGTNQSASTIFGQTSGFGNNQPQSSMFGQPSTNASGSSQTNIFGAQTTNPQALPPGNSSFPQGNTFGNFSQSSAFGSNTPLFGAQNPPVQQQSNLQGLSSQQQVSQSSLVYPQQTNLFSGQMSASFGQQNVQQTTGSFFNNSQAQPTTVSSSIFGNASNNTHILPQQPSNNVFGALNNQNTNQPVFGQTATLRQNTNAPFGQQTNAQSHSAHIFGNSQAGNFNSFATVAHAIDESLYSKKEDLSESDIEWYRSDNWDIMKIPEKPPTYDMCFGT